MSDKPDSEVEVKPAATGGMPKWMPILLMVNTAGMLGVGAMALTRHPAPAAEAGAGEEEAGGEAEKPEGHSKGPKVGPMLKLPEFTVRLHNPDVEHFARFTLEVELTKQKDLEEANARVPQIRDAFLSYLADRTAEELQGSAGLEKTKQGLGQRLTAVLGPRVKNLYVTDLVIQ